VRWHDLRHTCASSLVAAWWGPAWRLELVREVLGHSSITVTERYAHLAASVLDDAGAQTSGLAMTGVMVPAAVPGPTAADPRTPCSEGRDTQDSNLRPPASEAAGRACDSAELDALWDRLGTVAERYLRALEIRSRFAHAHGRELAEEVLLETRRQAEIAGARGVRRAPW